MRFTVVDLKGTDLADEYTCDSPECKQVAEYNLFIPADDWTLCKVHLKENINDLLGDGTKP